MASSYPSRSHSRSGSTDLEALKRRLAPKPRPPIAPRPPDIDFGATGGRISIAGPAGAMIIEGDGNIQIAGSHGGSISIVGSTVTASNIRAGGSISVTARRPTYTPEPEPEQRQPDPDEGGCHNPTCDDCNPGVNDRREILLVRAPTPERKGLGFWGFMAAATGALIIVGSAPWWITLGAAVGVVYVLRKDRLRLAELETRAAEARAVDSKDQAAQAQLAAADPEFAAEFDRRYPRLH